MLELVSGQEQEDAAGVGGETAHDMGERTEGEAPRLLHQQRVLVRRLLPVGGVSGRIVPRPVEATRRHLIPHCEREARNKILFDISRVLNNYCNCKKASTHTTRKLKCTLDPFKTGYCFIF